ncbi:MAG: IS66 family transposase, partial [Gammaproteobacteria bacterium]|nr:IS66 family transposase [Gammaproteobacteria bacterium]
MVLDPAQYPDDISALKAMLIAETKAGITAETRVNDRDAEIGALKLTSAKRRRDKLGGSSERGAKLRDQLGQQIAELEASVAPDTIAAELRLPWADGESTKQKPGRRRLPGHLPRERIVPAGSCICDGCVGNRLRKLSEDRTETLEYEPGPRKEIQNVRE